jgi:hypothetical protein
MRRAPPPPPPHTHTHTHNTKPMRVRKHSDTHLHGRTRTNTATATGTVTSRIASASLPARASPVYSTAEVESCSDAAALPHVCDVATLASLLHHSCVSGRHTHAPTHAPPPQRHALRVPRVPAACAGAANCTTRSSTGHPPQQQQQQCPQHTPEYRPVLLWRLSSGPPRDAALSTSPTKKLRTSVHITISDARANAHTHTHIHHVHE